MKKISFIVLVSFLFLGLSNSYAQDDGHKKHKKHGNSALKKEVKEYMKQNILPVLKEQRAKLEKDISAQDKTQLTAYRAELKKNHQLVKEGRKKRKEAKKSDSEFSQTEKEAIWIAEGQQKEIIHKTRDLSKTYKEKIQVLFDQISAKRDTWENDLKAIHEKYKDEAKDDEQEDGKHKDKKGHKKGQKGRKMMKMLRPVHFLLLDPNASEDELEEAFDDND